MLEIDLVMPYAQMSYMYVYVCMYVYTCNIQYRRWRACVRACVRAVCRQCSIARRLHVHYSDVCRSVCQWRAGARCAGTCLVHTASAAISWMELFHALRRSLTDCNSKYSTKTPNTSKILKYTKICIQCVCTFFSAILCLSVCRHHRTSSIMESQGCYHAQWPWHYHSDFLSLYKFSSCEINAHSVSCYTIYAVCISISWSTTAKAQEFSYCIHTESLWLPISVLMPSCMVITLWIHCKMKCKYNRIFSLENSLKNLSKNSHSYHGIHHVV